MKQTAAQVKKKALSYVTQSADGVARPNNHDSHPYGANKESGIKTKKSYQPPMKIIFLFWGLKSASNGEIKMVGGMPPLSKCTI